MTEANDPAIEKFASITEANDSVIEKLAPATGANDPVTEKSAWLNKTIDVSPKKHFFKRKYNELMPLNVHGVNQNY